MLRLGGWGFGACLALGIVATIANTDRGSERIQQVLSGLVDAPPPTQQVLVKTFDAETETRRLAQQLQYLNADRDRLAARVGSLERSLDDVTGSVKAVQTSRITAPPKSSELKSLEPKLPELSAAPPVISAPATVAATANPPMPANDNKPGAPPQPPIRAAELPKMSDKISDRIDAGHADTPITGAITSANTSASNQPVATPIPTLLPRMAPAESQSGKQAAARPEIVPETAPAEPLGNKLEFGIDLGGASSVESLRVLWQSTKAAHAPLLDTLQPSAVLRPTGKNGAPQLRLMAGPFADAGAAAALCKSFSVARGSNCRPFAFDGQKLPLR